MSRTFYFLSAVLLAGLCLTVGCDKAERSAVNYYLRSPEALEGMHKVVLIDLAPAEGRDARMVPRLTDELCQAIQNRRVFHVEVIHRDDPICEDLPLYKRGAYTLRELADIRKALKADGILIGKISKFQPYPRMQIAVFAQLFDLKEGSLVWAVDEVWDTTDKETARRIRTYFRKGMRTGYDPYDWELAMVSPRIFAKFVAYEIARTLRPPERPEKKGER